MAYISAAQFEGLTVVDIIALKSQQYLYHVNELRGTDGRWFSPLT